MNKTKTKRIHTTLLLIISTIFLYTFNALAMVTEFTAGYGSNIILPEAPNNEPNDSPATPIEILESTLEMSLPEFGQKLYTLKYDIGRISKDPLSFYSSPENININLNDYLSEAGTTVNTWIEAFNNTNSALPPELTTLNNKIQDIQEKVKRIETELGISIEEVAKTLDTQKEELEALALIPRDSDFYTEVGSYAINMSKQNDEYKQTFSEAGFSIEAFDNIQETILEVLDKSALHISSHVLATLTLPFEDLMNATKTADATLFSQLYITNVTKEIPQYNQDVSAVLEKYSADPAIYENPFMVKAINYLTEFHANIDALCKSGLLEIAGKTMHLYQPIISLNDKINDKINLLQTQSKLSPELLQELNKLKADKAHATLDFLTQLSILTEQSNLYIENEIGIKNGRVAQLLGLLHNMPPDDRKDINNDILYLKAEITLLKKIKILSSKSILFATEYAKSVVSQAFLEDKSYYDKTIQDISTTISRLETVKHHMLPDDAQIINGEIARLQREQDLLTDIYSQSQRTEVVNTPQPQIQSQNQPIKETYITAVAPIAKTLSVENSIQKTANVLKDNIINEIYEVGLAFENGDIPFGDAQEIIARLQEQLKKLPQQPAGTTSTHSATDPQRTQSPVIDTAAANTTPMPSSITIEDEIRDIKQQARTQDTQRIQSPVTDNAAPTAASTTPTLSQFENSPLDALRNGLSGIIGNNPVLSTLTKAFEVQKDTQQTTALKDTQPSTGVNGALGDMDVYQQSMDTNIMLGENTQQQPKDVNTALEGMSNINVLKTNNRQSIISNVGLELTSGGDLNEAGMTSGIFGQWKNPKEHDVNGEILKTCDNYVESTNKQYKNLSDYINKHPEITAVVLDEIATENGISGQNIKGIKFNGIEIIGIIGISGNSGNIVLTKEVSGEKLENNGSIWALEIDRDTKGNIKIGEFKIVAGKDLDNSILQNKIIQATENSEELKSGSNSGAIRLINVTITDENGKETTYNIIDVIGADTIVYINSTKPGVIIKEILKHILINRPNASEAMVNRAFLLIVIIGLICIGFGVGLAVYITRLQLKKSNYFNPVLSHKKAYQHNFAPSWKTR